MNSPHKTDWSDGHIHPRIGEKTHGVHKYLLFQLSKEIFLRILGVELDEAVVTRDRGP
jgi:hypothetical protein